MNYHYNFRPLNQLHDYNGVSYSEPLNSHPPDFLREAPKRYTHYQTNQSTFYWSHPTNESRENQTAFGLDSSGWYIPIPADSVPTQYAHLSPTPLTLNSPGSAMVHDFWKGRLAPFPGFSSQPGLITTTGHKRIKIIMPHAPLNKTLQLLPPHPFKKSGSPERHPLPSSRFTDRSASTENISEKNEPQRAFQFDIYADVFIPQYLKEIQKQPHTLLPLPSVPLFPPTSYIQTFLLPHLIEEFCRPRNPTLLSDPPADVSPGLRAETYHKHWMTLLGWELDKLALDKEQIILWKVGLRVVIWADAEFVLSVPGIRENHPRLEIGDLVQMREVIQGAQRGSGIAFEGRVVALRKREGLIHLYCPTLKTHVQKFIPAVNIPQSGPPIFTPDDVLPMSFNISFTVNARPLFIMETAVSIMGNALADHDNPHNLARYWLFPDPQDLESPFSVPSIDHEPIDNEWIDSGLNIEQRSAVSSVALHRSLVPYLISGPPGTGKTRTMVETVLQILRIQHESCVLVCAPSNSATDTLALRLKPFLMPHEMLRLNDQNRTFAEVPIKLVQYCYIENDKFALPPWKTIMKYRVVVCSCLDAGILLAAQCTNISLMRLEEEIASSLHPHRKDSHSITPHWTHLLIDEAAQASEPELVIPISVVFSQLTTSHDMTDATTTFIPQLVLCGDPQQLGPIISSEKGRRAELDVSLLERLFERPLYANHDQARSTMQHTSFHVFKPKPFFNLVKNYRSHPAILMPPSAMFYDDSLEPHAKNGVVMWSGLSNCHLPLIFIGHQNIEESVDERATWYNNGEIDCIVRTITSLLSEGPSSSPPLQPADIGIITPWRQQVWKLRERLRKEKLNAVDVGTVEDYQGRESRIIIISCVRSSQRFLKEDSEKGLGLMFEKKRMNVAITRARELLIVIGNGEILQQDPYWKGFLQFSIRNKIYLGPELNIEMDGNYISRLESNYIYARTGGMEMEDQGEAIAGGIAREVLRDGSG